MGGGDGGEGGGGGDLWVYMCICERQAQVTTSTSVCVPRATVNVHASVPTKTCTHSILSVNFQQLQMYHQHVMKCNNGYHLICYLCSF